MKQKPGKPPSRKPIDWHKECVQNFEKTLKDRQREAKTLAKAIDRMTAELSFYKTQIAEAEARGMQSFDSERLLVKRPRAEKV